MGISLTAVLSGGSVPSAIARNAAIGVALSLATLGFIEIRQNSESLLRADLIALAALYYFLLFEFLFPQPAFDNLARLDETETTVFIVLGGFAATILGRHFVSKRVRPWQLVHTAVPARSLVLLFWLSFAIGYFHMLLAVGFNPVSMVEWFLEPRFSQPWTRQRYGDLRALLGELGAMIALVPPLGGVILGRRRQFAKRTVVIVTSAVVFTIFYGFSTGTRSILGGFLITFLAAYYYAARSRRQIYVLGFVAAVLMLVSTVYGTEFRTVGLRNYIAYGGRSGMTVGTPEQFFVDYNLLSVSRLVAVFPEKFDYLGWAGPLWIVVRIIPRALWPGKPDAVNLAPETYLGIENATVATTFIGEAYMCAGAAGVIVAGICVGWLASWWTRKAFSTKSELAILLYGSGFFAVVTTIRSMYWLPVAILPTVAAAVLSRFLTSRKRRRPLTPIRG